MLLMCDFGTYKNGYDRVNRLHGGIFPPLAPVSLPVVIATTRWTQMVQVYVTWHHKMGGKLHFNEKLILI